MKLRKKMFSSSKKGNENPQVSSSWSYTRPLRGMTSPHIDPITTTSTTTSKARVTSPNNGKRKFNQSSSRHPKQFSAYIDKRQWATNIRHHPEEKLYARKSAVGGLQFHLPHVKPENSFWAAFDQLSPVSNVTSCHKLDLPSGDEAFTRNNKKYYYPHGYILDARAELQDVPNGTKKSNSTLIKLWGLKIGIYNNWVGSQFLQNKIGLLQKLFGGTVGISDSRKKRDQSDNLITTHLKWHHISFEKDITGYSYLPAEHEKRLAGHDIPIRFDRGKARNHTSVFTPLSAPDVGVPPTTNWYKHFLFNMRPNSSLEPTLWLKHLTGKNELKDCIEKLHSCVVLLSRWQQNILLSKWVFVYRPQKHKRVSLGRRAHQYENVDINKKTLELCLSDKPPSFYSSRDITLATENNIRADNVDETHSLFNDKFRELFWDQYSACVCWPSCIKENLVEHYTNINPITFGSDNELRPLLLREFTQSDNKHVANSSSSSVAGMISSTDYGWSTLDNLQAIDEGEDASHSTPDVSGLKRQPVFAELNSMYWEISRRSAESSIPLNKLDSIGNRAAPDQLLNYNINKQNHGGARNMSLVEGRRVELRLTFSRNNYFITLINQDNGATLYQRSAGRARYQMTRQKRAAGALLLCLRKFARYVHSKRLRSIHNLIIKYEVYRTSVQTPIEKTIIGLLDTLRQHGVWVETLVLHLLRSHASPARKTAFRRK